MKKKVLNLIFSFFVIGNVYTSTTTPTTPLTVPRAQGPIIIDGVGNESTWNSIPAIGIGIAKTLKDPSFGGNFKLTYDNYYIYVLVTVNDNTPNQNGTSAWQSDCVELFFAMDTNTHNSYQSGDWQIRKLSSESQASMEYASPNVSKLLADPNFKVEQIDMANGYVQEWQIPINTLIEDAAFDGQHFRFDIQLANNDGTGNERTDQRFWNDGADDQWNQTTHFGYIRMIEKIDDFGHYCQYQIFSVTQACDSINFLKQRIYQENIQKNKLTDSITLLNNMLINTTNQLEEEKNKLTDSIAVLKNMLVNEQYITLYAFNEVSTSVTMKQGKVDLQIYPNPARDRILINCSETISGYSIFSTSGSLISTSKISSTTAPPYEITLPSLSSGIYYLHLQTSKGVISILFLLQDK